MTATEGMTAVAGTPATADTPATETDDGNSSKDDRSNIVDASINMVVSKSKRDAMKGRGFSSNRNIRVSRASITDFSRGSKK